jgi:hypothetical protein
MTVSPATPEYLKWSKVFITFDRSDHPDIVPKPGWYPLIVSPIIKDVKLNQVLVDIGSSLNILFLKTFNQMGLCRAMLRPSRAPFHGIVPSATATPIGQITLPVTFEIGLGRQIQDGLQHFLWTTDTLQVHGDSSLCLLGLKNARTAWCHLNQRRHQACL